MRRERRKTITASGVKMANMSNTWVASEITVLTFHRLRGADG